MLQDEPGVFLRIPNPCSQGSMMPPDSAAFPLLDLCNFGKLSPCGQGQVERQAAENRSPKKELLGNVAKKAVPASPANDSYIALGAPSWPLVSTQGCAAMACLPAL